MRQSGSSPDITAQPGAQPGQRVFCVVSGVSFEVKESSPRRDVAGRPAYFCCDSCARYFDENRDRVLAIRGISAGD